MLINKTFCKKQNKTRSLHVINNQINPRWINNIFKNQELSGKNVNK